MAGDAKASLTAAAIRTAECAEHPMCVIVSERPAISYAFPSPSFKNLGRNIYLRKGSLVPAGSTTEKFNADFANIRE